MNENNTTEVKKDSTPGKETAAEKKARDQRNANKKNAYIESQQ